MDRSKPITSLKAARAVDFIVDLIHYFSLPNCIITELGSNFPADEFYEFCERSGINVRYVSVTNPRSNSEVEHANGMIVDGPKKIIYEAKDKRSGKWIHELLHIIWGLRTQPFKGMGPSPYFFFYGSKVILLVDIMWQSARLEMYKEG